MNLGKFKILIRTDDNGMLHFIGMKTIRNSRTFNTNMGSAMTAEVVSGERMGMGAAFTAMTIAQDTSARSTAVSAEILA